MLIGTSGVGQTFTKEVVEAMSSFNEVVDPLKIVPLILLDKNLQKKFYLIKDMNSQKIES